MENYLLKDSFLEDEILQKEGFNNKYLLSGVIDDYNNAVESIGLWISEGLIFDRYLRTEMDILDMGCGAGRVTINLHRKGFENIQGLDLSSGMITAAKKTAKRLKTPIKFTCCDARHTRFSKGEFDACIFAFNGLMTIPKRENRAMVLAEVSRILKPGGIFIFTTHDMHDPDYLSYWIKETARWQAGTQDENIFEFGDMVIPVYKYPGQGAVFLHIPEYDEVYYEVEKVGLEVIEKVLRSDICEESLETQQFSDDCLFWICKKS